MKGPIKRNAAVVPALGFLSAAGSASACEPPAPTCGVVGARASTDLPGGRVEWLCDGSRWVFVVEYRCFEGGWCIPLRRTGGAPAGRRPAFDGHGDGDGRAPGPASANAPRRYISRQSMPSSAMWMSRPRPSQRVRGRTVSAP